MGFYCTLMHGLGVFVGSLFSGSPNPYRAFCKKICMVSDVTSFTQAPDCLGFRVEVMGFELFARKYFGVVMR